MKRTKVERLAEELARVHDPGWAEWAAKGPGRFDHWKRLARHVLKRERKAKGKTVGFVEVRKVWDGNPAKFKGYGLARHRSPTLEPYRRQDGCIFGAVPARVVLVPKKRRAR